MLKFSVISPDATYQLNTSVSPVNEGQSSTITLNTTGVQEGQAIPYTISGVGITTDDISGAPLTGNFVVSGGVATKTLNIANDLTTEGQETLTMSLGNGTNVSLAINDTSVTPAAGDPFWDNTVLSIHGGQNDKYDATFADSSNTMIVTKHGFVSQGVSSPFSGIPNSGSIRLINGIDYISVPYSSNINFQGDFTVECWFKFDTATFWQYICGKGLYGVNHDFSLILTSATTITTYSNGTTTNLRVTVPTMQPNTWYHVAFVRASGVNKIYLNGISYGSNTMSISNSNTTDPFVIGRQTSNNSTSALTGNISNFRITKNAVYASNFTPSSTPLALVSGTVLLLNCENTGVFNNNNNHTFVDSSTNNLTITRTGNVSQGSFSPFITTGGSAYFDRSGDSLSLAATHLLGFGTGDFTFEAWVYREAVGEWHTIFDNRTSASQTATTFTISTTDKLSVYDSGANVTRLSATSIPAKVWTHVATTRQGSTLRLFINGVLDATYTLTADLGISQPLLVGQNRTAGNDFRGYISNLHIVKGTALYTSNFTPSTTTLTAVANTSLLLKFENAGTIDATRNNVLGTVGNVVSGAQKKFGNTSLYFNGTSSNYVRIPDSTNFVLGTAFTIEFYMYATAGANAGGKYNSPIGQRPAGGVHSWYCHVCHNASIGFCGPAFEYRGTNGAVAVTALSTNPAHLTPLNTWVHIAITYDGSTIRTFQNGSIVAQAAYTGSIGDVASPLTVGAVHGTSEWFSGYIDDLRITKGVARYTSNFIVPTAAFPDIKNENIDPFWNNVVLGMHMDGMDNGTTFTELTGKTVTRYGNTVTKTSVKKFGTASAYFDGSGDSLTVPYNAIEFDWWTSNYTLEYWINVSNMSTVSYLDGGSYPKTVIIGNRSLYDGDDYWSFGPLSDGSVRFYWWTGATNHLTTAPGLITTNNWYHLALANENGTIKIFIDGILRASTSLTGSPLSHATYPIAIGQGSNTSFNGYIDDIRITKGVVRYVTNFTPPTRSFAEMA